MDAPTIESEAPAASPDSRSASLETVELELALDQREVSDEQFETAIRETVQAVGGVLLFQMKLDESDGSRWVAAVALGTGDDREIAIIDLPCNGGSVTVRPAAESSLPIASIASAYAGLAERWATAA